MKLYNFWFLPVWSDTGTLCGNDKAKFDMELSSKFENCDCHNVYTSKQPLQETLASYRQSRYKKFSDSNSGRKQARRQGGVRGVRTHPPPRSQKGPPNGIVKDLQWCKITCDGRIDNLNAFPAVWRTQISNFFPGEHAPGSPLKPFQSVQPYRFRRDCCDFTWESWIPTQLQSGHEYPDFEDQLLQAN